MFLLTYSKDIANSNFDFFVLSQDCETYNKKVNIPANKIIACVAKDIDVVNYFAQKKIKFIINPFDDKQRFFDYSTINLMKQNGIRPVIMLNELSKLNSTQKIYFMKHAQALAKFCKDEKLPIIIDSGLSPNLRSSELQELALYTLFGFTKEQGLMFNKITFSDDDEN